VQPAILSETAVIALEPFMNSPRLIKFWAAGLDVENFLNSDHVRIQFGDHGSDAIGIGASSFCRQVANFPANLIAALARAIDAAQETSQVRCQRDDPKR